MARTRKEGHRLTGALAATLLLGVGLSAPAAHAETASTPVVFPGNGVKVQVDHRPQALQRTSPSFRRFLGRELDELWGWDDRKLECRTAPVIFVKEFRRSGFAFLNEGVYAAPHHPECADGGHAQFAVRRDGRWISPRALGTQDLLSCRVLRKWDIPRMSGATSCLAGDSVVDYHPVG